jgi:hypothetical protein
MKYVHNDTELPTDWYIPKLENDLYSVSQEERTILREGVP